MLCSCSIFDSKELLQTQGLWRAVQARMPGGGGALDEADLAAAQVACAAAERAVAAADDAEFEATAAQVEAERLARHAPRRPTVLDIALSTWAGQQDLVGEHGAAC